MLTCTGRFAFLAMVRRLRIDSGESFVWLSSESRVCAVAVILPTPQRRGSVVDMKNATRSSSVVLLAVALASLPFHQLSMATASRGWCPPQAFLPGGKMQRRRRKDNRRGGRR